MVKVSYVLHYKCLFLPKFNKLSKFSCCVVCSHFIWRVMSKYEAVYFVGDNQAINRVRVDSSKTRNRGAFSGSLAALVISTFKFGYPRLILKEGSKVKSDHTRRFPAHDFL